MSSQRSSSPITSVFCRKPTRPTKLTIRKRLLTNEVGPDAATGIEKTHPTTAVGSIQPAESNLSATGPESTQLTPIPPEANLSAGAEDIEPVCFPMNQSAEPSLSSLQKLAKPSTSPPRSDLSLIDLNSIISSMVVSTFISPLSPTKQSTPPTNTSISPTTSERVNHLISETLTSSNKEFDSDSSDESIINLTKPIRKTCCYIFQRGSKKSQKCINSVKGNAYLCSQHKNSISKEKTYAELAANSKIVNVKQPSKVTLTKINRLKLNEKYYFVRQMQHKCRLILLRNNNTYYKLRLPKALQLPSDSKHYLIRKPFSLTTWQRN